jgi:hypothetical protein
LENAWYKTNTNGAHKNSKIKPTAILVSVTRTHFGSFKALRLAWP